MKRNKTSELTISNYVPRTITFHDDNDKQIGELDFSNGKLKFKGNAEKSAKVFIDYCKKLWET